MCGGKQKSKAESSPTKTVVAAASDALGQKKRGSRRRRHVKNDEKQKENGFLLRRHISVGQTVTSGECGFLLFRIIFIVSVAVVVYDVPYSGWGAVI